MTDLVKRMKDGASVDVDLPCGVRAKLTPNMAAFNKNEVVGVTVVLPNHNVHVTEYNVEIYISGKNFKLLNELLTGLLNS